MNLIVTCISGFEVDSLIEIEEALMDIDEKVDVKKTYFRGVLEIKTTIPSRKAAKILKNARTTAISKIIPVDMVVKSEIGCIVESAVKLAKSGVDAEHKIVKEDTFAVRCKRRGMHSFTSKDIEKIIGERIVREVGAKVNLEHPKKIVKVEVIQDRSGISILKSDELVIKNTEGILWKR